jgi:vacuolar-type H+-ATPase subunit E/Vma4
VRDALLAGARQEASALLAEADAESAARVREAEQQGEEIRDRARAEGEADARTVLVAERARARRQARAVVLAAQSEVRDELGRRVHEALARLRDDPAFPEMQGRLEAQARALLGDRARLTPHPSGGCTAEAPGRRVEVTLAAVADRELERLGPELEALWTR